MFYFEVLSLYSLYLSQLPNICNSEEINIKSEKRKFGFKKIEEYQLVNEGKVMLMTPET